MSDSCVYVADKDFAWLPANVVSHDANSKVTVKVFDIDGQTALGERTVSLNEYPNNQLPLQNVDAGGHLMEMADMVDLPSLHEAAILYNLRKRHSDMKPYTRVGDLIIAVNPFQWMEELYSEANRAKYVNQLIYQPNTSGSDVRAGLAPHVYETSCMAYRGLSVENKNQSILVSGESGAGKTETVKIVMKHLASVTQTDASVVVQRVLDGQPLLEAFGNAKTVRNDNSSRFGKFIQMQFDVEDATQAAYSGRAVPNCVLAGSSTETYLLEKSRVVSHESGERTYHIFYQVLAAKGELKEMYLPELVGKTSQDFKYVGHSDTTKIEGMLDGDRFEKTLNALKMLDMNDEKLKMLFKAVICVMLLGNISFDIDPSDSEKCIIASPDHLEALRESFGVSIAAMEKALTFRTIVTGKERFQTPLKAGDARDGCDAFAKEIYQQIFDWLVRETNSKTCAENNYADATDVEEYGLIGLLDIFGFESFEVNRFEQLCINYTNEKLQQKYTLDIFRSVQEEYSHEGIELGEITFEDNAEVLRLIEGKIGIISVLNEECVRPKGNDQAFVSKVKEINKDVSCLVSEKLHKPTEFAIKHYAGSVKYDATNFVQKNTDALPNDLIECACMSSNEIISVEVKAAADAKIAGSSRAGKRGATTLTVATKFKTQLTRLMADITETQTRYIRCIKPNPEKEPLKMNMFSSAEQLRCAGVVAAVTISRVAFPNRLMHETALERFSCLGHISLDSLIEKKKEASDDDETGYKEAVQILFQDLLKDMEKTDEGSVTRAFECGRSRIYFRTGALESLEAKRLVALGSFATVIERIVRGFTARSLFWKLKYASIDSQANARRVIGRNKFLRARAAAVRLECWVRCIFASNELMCLRREKASTRIQSMWRAFVAVVNYIRIKAASVIIQKIVRGAMQRPKYRQALKDAEEEARVNSKLAALQKRLQEAEMKFFQAEKGRIEAEKRAAEGGGSLVNAQVAESPATKPDLGDVPGGSAQQQALIDESNEMLDYFRKEVFKLKSANYLLRTDFAALQEEHRTLQSHVQSTEASYSAMRQNIAKLSQSNMRLAVELGEEKNFIQKLKKDLKMEKQRLSSEVKRKSEEVLGRDKMHEAEIATLKRELARMRQIIAQNGVKVSEHEEKSSAEHKFERASFHHNPLRESVLRNISVPQEEGGPASSLSRASLTSVVLSRPLITPPSSAPSSEDEGWTTVQSTRKPRYGQPPPPLGSYGSYGGRGRGGRHFNSPPPYRSGPPPYRGGAPRTPSSHAGRGRASPSYTTPGYTPPGLNPISPQVNAGTSLGAAAKAKSQNNLAALAQSGSSLAAAAATGNSSQSKSLPKRDSVTK